MAEDENLVEAMARSIYDADNGIDGDTIAEIIHENFRIETADGNRGIDNTMAVCRIAARAALAAARETGYTIVPMEPTEAMAAAGVAAFTNVYDIWRDMIAAASP